MPTRVIHLYSHKLAIRQYFFELKNYNKYRLDKYTTQLNFRLNEGDGSCIYVIGVNDSGSIYGLDELETELTVLEGENKNLKGFKRFLSTSKSSNC